MREPLATTPSLFYQGEMESKSYTFDWSHVGTPVNPVACKLFDAVTDTDISATNLTGAAAISGDTVITPAAHGLDRNGKYRLHCTVTIGGNTLEAYLYIYGQL